MNEEKVQPDSPLPSTRPAVPSSSVKLIKLAEDLAEITPFAKADTEGMMALFAGMGFTEDQIVKLTPTLQDLTVVMKKNGDEGAILETTARLLGRSILADAAAWAASASPSTRIYGVPSGSMTS